MKSITTRFKQLAVFTFISIVTILPLVALTSTEQVRVLLDDIEVNRPEDKEAAALYQATLKTQLASLGRYDLMTKESIKEKLSLKAKADAGLELTDKEMASAASVAGAKYMMRARLSDVKKDKVKMDKLVLNSVEARLTIRLIETETVTSIGVLRYRLSQKGSELASWNELIRNTASELRGRLSFDLKSLMLIQADVTEAKGGVVDLSRGKNTGIAFLQRYRLYNNQRLKIENEYGEEAEEIIRIPAGDMRIIKTDSNTSRGEMRRFLAPFSKDMTAIEWNLRNMHMGVSLGLTTFGVTVASNQLGGNTIDTNRGQGFLNTNYFIQIDGTDNPAYSGSRIGVGASRFSPYVNFDFGWGPGKFILLGRVNVVATSPLISISFDPGFRLDLIETGTVNFSLGVNAKLGYLGGRLGTLQFIGANNFNHYAADYLADLSGNSSVPSGSTIDMVNFFVGASGTATLGFNVSESSRVAISGGYEFIPAVTPKLYFSTPEVYSGTSKASMKELPADFNPLIFQTSSALTMSRIFFGISYQTMY